MGEGFDDWHDRFPQPDQSDLQGGQFYSFDVADAHFVLDLFAARNYQLNPGTTRLDRSRYSGSADNGADWVIPFMHASPYSDGANHPNALAARINSLRYSNPST